MPNPHVAKQQLSVRELCGALDWRIMGTDDPEQVVLRADRVLRIREAALSEPFLCRSTDHFDRVVVLEQVEKEARIDAWRAGLGQGLAQIDIEPFRTLLREPQLF